MIIQPMTINDITSNAGILPLIFKDNKIYIIDQSILPYEEHYYEVNSLEQIISSIKTLKIRGAPAIGLAAAVGMYLAIAEYHSQCLDNGFLEYLQKAKIKLNESRPTAVNLSFVSEKMHNFILSQIKIGYDFLEILDLVLDKIKQIYNTNILINKKISYIGESIIKSGYKIMTHCNAGPLATGGWGTALGIIRAAHFNNKNIEVFVNETRPLNQGARLTTYELFKDKIKATLSLDSASGYLIKQQKINLIIIGADRIAVNGDTANKIGSYNLAILAKYHNIPFYVAAPFSTIDISITNGYQIPIEYRHKDEIIYCHKSKIAFDRVTILNPSFDVTPNELITGIITEYGIIYPPYDSQILQKYQLSLEDKIYAY